MAFRLPGKLDKLLDEVLQGVITAAEDAKHITIRSRASSALSFIGLGREDDLNPYSILQAVPKDTKNQLRQVAQEDNLFNRAMGSIQGMAVGDSLGHPFEFLAAQDTPSGPRFDLARMEFINPSNAFRLKPGQWTDDAAMGLCMADSFILRKRFDGSDMRIRFWCWWNRGYNNAFRHDGSRSSSVGLGGNIAKSLMEISQLPDGALPQPAYNSATEDAGNGSLMRFAPAAIFCHSCDPAKVMQIARDSSFTTHPGVIAAEACALLSYLIVKALNLPPGEPASAAAFLDEATAEYLAVSGLREKVSQHWGYEHIIWLVTSSPPREKERCWNWKHPDLDIAGTLRARGRTYNGYPVSAGYFGSYSLDGLAMALWAVYHTNSFDEAVVKSVNLLGDADSHGSITGQLAGALYGYRAINPQFNEWVSTWDHYEIAARGVLLAKLGARS